MHIIYKTGDLLQCDENIIAHGCNAQGVMGAGVAKAIKEKYPGSYEYYRYMWHHGMLRPGSILTYQESDKMIVHMITQPTFGRGPEVYVKYEAVKSCIEELNRTFTGHSVAMPKIGAGLGGGDWDEIARIIERESTHFQPVVYTL